MTPPTDAAAGTAAASDLRPERSATLAAEIRRRRLDAGFTLVQLAERSGLSQPFLSQVENERAQPSMESLARIAQALGTTPQSLFAAPAGHAAPLAVVRSGDDPGGPSTYRPLVAGDAPFHVVEFTELPFEFVDPWTHDGFEAAYVVRGRVEIDVGGTLTRLGPGDSVSYDARLPHRHRSLGRRPARLLLIETSTRHPPL
ncbi:MAG: XRE family transcriptional regulator [Ilumatobacteraceae bacterium]